MLNNPDEADHADLDEAHGNEDQPPKESALDQFLSKQQLKELEHKNLLKELNKTVDLNDHSVLNHVIKKYSHGKFMQMFSEGNFVDKVAKGADFDWVCHDNQPKDFLTLIRFALISKLSRRANLHSRCFVSRDSKSIFMVIKGSDETLELEASAQEYTKQLEIGFADLMSLEPCDNKLRPLRCKNILRE